MARGNQREISRQRNQAKQAQKAKGSTREGTPLQRNEDDKAALAAKVAAKQAAKAQAEQAEANTANVIKPKPKPKKDDGLDDLLNAGLTAKKGKK